MTTSIQPEFSRRIAVDTIGSAPRTITIHAEAEESAALARRFDWLGVAGLEATLSLVKKPAGIVVSGHLTAAVTQVCVATGAPVDEAVASDFALTFTDSVISLHAGESVGDEEIELTDSDLDTMEFDGHAVDVGEVVAQSLALAVSDFPRCSDADTVLRAAGVIAEDDVAPNDNPFARALKQAGIGQPMKSADGLGANEPGRKGPSGKKDRP